MKVLSSNCNIIACSTGTTSNTAISVIRICGTEILEPLNHLFSINLLEIKSRYAYFCNFQNDQLHKIDEIVVTFFKGPNSYNGEDTLELSVHGNQINIRRIIGEVLKIDGFEHAKPGEFTLRALNNGKLSLNQVEGLDLLLNANNIFSLDQGFSLLSGKLKNSFLDLQKIYLQHRSSIEFGFDFLEDIGEERFKAQLDESFEELKKKIYKLHSHVSNQNYSLLKPEVVLYGLPNAGKSTIFNLLLNEDRAITSEIAGTTRDYIREDIRIGENIFSLIDTAGIRSSTDNIENVGIEKAIDLVENSFFKILLINPFEFNESYFNSVRDVNFDQIIITHSDRLGFENAFKSFLSRCPAEIANRIGPIEPKKAGPIEPKKTGPIEPKKTGPIEPKKAGPIEPKKTGPIEPKKTGPIEPKKTGPIEPKKTGPIEPIVVSLISDKFEFTERVCKAVDRKYTKLLSFDPVLIQRHGDTIKIIYNSFQQYEQIYAVEDDMAVIASELNILGHCISELLGIVSVDDVLHNIFDNFCIGK